MDAQDPKPEAQLALFNDLARAYLGIWVAPDGRADPLRDTLLSEG